MQHTIWTMALLHLAFVAALFVPLAILIRKRKKMPWSYSLGAAALPYATAMFVVTLALVLLVAKPDPIMGMMPYGFFFLFDAFAAILGAIAMALGAWRRLRLLQAELERRDATKAES